MRFTRLVALLLFATITLSAHAQKPGLDIYFVDTEGGAATLIVTPSRESVLIDCGNPGDRDADRIYHVAHDVAHLTAIDHLIITHWHTDHYGGVERLSAKIPIRHFYDRGIPESLADDPTGFPKLIAAYKAASQGKSNTLHPGDTLPFEHPSVGPLLELRCLCANKEVVPDKPNAVKNGYAKENKPMPEDASDNANSLGFVLTYGYFRFLDLGDLTWNIEYKLVSPSDKIGLIDVYQSSHHGLDISNNPVVIKTIRPVVAVYNNGPHKGGSPQLTQSLADISSMAAIFELHRNLDAPPQNIQGKTVVIANMDDPCKGEFIHLQVSDDSKTYSVGVGEKANGYRFDSRVPIDPAKVKEPKTTGILIKPGAPHNLPWVR